MHPRTIVLFTTDAHDRTTARQLVAGETHDIEEFDSAEAALASLLDDPCAVALVDLEAPGASEILTGLRARADRARMPILGASRRERPADAALCDHVEVGPRPFLTVAVELALALEETEAVRAGQTVRTGRDAPSIGVVRAASDAHVVLHLFRSGRRTIPLSAVERVEGDSVIVDAAALPGEIADAMFRDEEGDGDPRFRDAPERSAMRSSRTADRARHASQRRHPRARPRALSMFAARLAQRWAAPTRAA